MSEPFRVTFVCSGNICRSPMAESVFRHHVEQAGLDAEVEVDSSGTGGWHAGSDADQRAVRTLRQAGYRSAHSARQFQAAWFDDYDLIIALDNGHVDELLAMAPDAEARDKIRLLRSFDPDADTDTDAFDLDVPDPYYGDSSGFEHVLKLIEAAVPGLLDEVRKGLERQGRQG